MSEEEMKESHDQRLKKILRTLAESLNGLYGILRNYFLTGMLILIPLAVTVFIFVQLFLFADSILGDALSRALGYQIPGAGLFVTLLIFIMAGAIAQNVLGRRLLKWIEFSLESVPIVRSVYLGAKEVSGVFFQNKKGEFKRVVLVEYPKEDSWVVAFVTGDFPTETYTPAFKGNDMICVFVPTTPNPTSGFLLILEKAKVRDTLLGVEEAMKLIISGGLVRPGLPAQLAPGATIPPQEDFTIPH